MPTSDENERNRDTNPDPITGEPGSHPVGTGIGAAGGGAAGAAAGTAIGGPIGAAVGAVIGAVAGGLAGKGVGEAIDPTAEDAYWRENHPSQAFARDRSYDDYAPAYRAGYEGYSKHYREGVRYEDVEPELRRDYETNIIGGTSTIAPSATESIGSRARLGWEEAKDATKAAWNRVASGEHRARRDPRIS